MSYANPFAGQQHNDEGPRFTRCVVCNKGYADATGRCKDHRGQRRGPAQLDRGERLYQALSAAVWALPGDRLSAVPNAVYEALLLPPSQSSVERSREAARTLITMLRVVRSIAEAGSIVPIEVQA